MPLYLAELYRASGEGDDLVKAAARARAAADGLARTGTRVRCIRSVFVPDDETWFLLYEAPSAAAVAEAAGKADLRVERVVEALES